MPASNTRPDAFFLPTNNLANAQTIVREIEVLLAERGIELRPPPPIPSTCCGRGCHGCVWQGYFAALGYWREQAREMLFSVEHEVAASLTTD